MMWLPRVGSLAIALSLSLPPSGLIAAPPESPKAAFDRAVQALSSGDYPLAEQEFKTVLRQEPSNVGAIGNLGILYARTNRTDKAIAQYKHALQLSPNDEPILLNLGLAYLKQEMHAQALPYFAKVVSLDATNTQARQLLAVCRLYAGQVPAAIHDLEQLKAANPHDEQLLFLLGFAYLKNGDAAKSKAIFNEMFEVAGPARTQFLLGRAAYEAEIFPQAEESFREVAKLDPNFPGLHLELGKLYISERRTDDAIRELKLVLASDPNNEDACYFLGSLLVQQNHEAEGIPYLERARALKPDSWAVYFYLGRAKLRLGEKSAAIDLLKKAVELNPVDATAQYQLARALQDSGQTAAAAQAFNRAKVLRVHEFDRDTIPGVR